MEFFRHSFTTGFGPLRILWGQQGHESRVVHIALPKDGKAAGGGPPSPGLARIEGYPVIEGLKEKILAFLRGEKIEFNLDVLCLESCTSFQREVLRAEHAIPRGSVSTYGLIARRLGRPAASRAVGNALARNPFPLAIPCHRALRSDGSMGGFQGGSAMKEALLRMEGVPFSTGGRVLMHRPYYR